MDKQIVVKMLHSERERGEREIGGGREGGERKRGREGGRERERGGESVADYNASQ